MKNISNEIQLSTIGEIKTESFLIDLFSPSKNRLKKYFDKNFLQRVLFSKKAISLPIDFVNDGEINPEYDGPLIDIIFEDENFLVMNKPHNIFVHPLTYSETNNCLSFLRSKNINVLNVNKKNYDRGLLYRLDFETSGVLIYVKNDSAYFELRDQFNSIAKEKIYLAKVEGIVNVRGSVKNYLTASGASGSKMKAHSIDAGHVKDGMLAELEILDSTYNSKTNESIVKIKLLSGHRHQIRAQLSFLNFPIVGDVLYGGVLSERLFLHAYKYRITYQEKSYEFEVLPSKFN